jgi:hypothetical protein
MIARDPKSDELIRPYVRGRDFDRWNVAWAGYWMIALRSSENADWRWATAGSDAERVFRNSYPAIYEHLDRFRDALSRREDQGRYWWELRSCAYWSKFEEPKIMYPEITWRAQWAIDSRGLLCNNTAYFLPTSDEWIVAVANSPACWWYAWRKAIHGKDEALRFIKDFVSALPIPEPSNEQRNVSTQIVNRLAEIAELCRQGISSLLYWLRVEYDVAKPTKRLQQPISLDSEAFVAEVRQSRGKKKPFTAAALQNLQDEYVRSIDHMRKLAGEALVLERQLGDVVNEAYHLTPQEVTLMWQSAPPRMPFRPSEI